MEKKFKKRGNEKNIKEVLERNAKMPLEQFLAPKKNKIPNLEKVVERLKQAKKAGEIVTVVGDYDADGICSSAILWHLLTRLQMLVRVIIPDRLTDGYGISADIVNRVEGSLILCVDNGIAAYEAIAHAKEIGKDVIILDHHPTENELPPADIIIDPMQLQDTFPYYCGAGLAYKLVELIYEDFDPDFVTSMRCLAAIATVGDVMPLRDENRLIVKGGLEEMMSELSPIGLRTILTTKKVIEPTSEDLAFKVCPLLNGAGRMIKQGAMLGFATLCAMTEGDALICVQKLEELNEERKSATELGLFKAEEILADISVGGLSILTLYLPDTPEGIMGILAGKLSEKYQKPVICLTDGEDGLLKGSGRSVEGCDLKSVLDAHKDLLKKYGGHPAAVGLSVAPDVLEELVAVLAIEEIEIKTSEDTIFYDLEISEEEIPALIEDLKLYEPYGEGFRKPVVKVLIRPIPQPGGMYKTMKSDGMKFQLKNKVSALSFGLSEEYTNAGSPHSFEVVGEVSESVYSGFGSKEFRNAQILFTDFAACEPVLKTTSFANLLADVARKF